MTATLHKIIKEANDKNPVALKEEFSRELISRIGGLIEAKKAAMAEDEDEEDGSDEDTNGNGSSSDENDEDEDEEDDLKEGFGADSKFSYAVEVSGVSKDFFKQPFGRQMDDMKKLKEFMSSAKKTHVGAKGKSTMAAVKKWVKEAKPSQYYAKWQSDSANYKDDSVEVYYK